MHGSEPSPLLSLNVTWIWGGSSAFHKKAWAPAAPFSERFAAPLFEVRTRFSDHCVLGLFLEDGHITSYSCGSRVPCVTSWSWWSTSQRPRLRASNSVFRIMLLRRGHMVFLRYAIIPVRCLIPRFRSMSKARNFNCESKWDQNRHS